jgi:hypothetical protein
MTTQPMTTPTTISEQIKALDAKYVFIWAQMQDYAKGSKKHKELQKQFLQISAELVTLKKSIA